MAKRKRTPLGEDPQVAVKPRKRKKRKAIEEDIPDQGGLSEKEQARQLKNQRRKERRRRKKLEEEGYTPEQADDMVSSGEELPDKAERDRQLEAFRTMDNKKGRVIYLLVDEQAAIIEALAEDPNYQETLERNPKLLPMLTQMSWYDLRGIYNLLGNVLLPNTRLSGERQGLVGK